VEIDADGKLELNYKAFEDNKTFFTEDDDE
jgi:hypothetical protein